MMEVLIPLHGGSLDDVLVVKEMHEYKADDTGAYLGQQVRYWCEGCGYAHDIGAQGPEREPYKGGPSWTWNGDTKLPVLSPSQLHSTYHWPRDGTPEEQAEADAILAKPGGIDAIMAHPKFGHRCHTFIGINGAPPGHIIYLSDCSKSEMRGKVLKLLPRHAWPDRYWSRLGVQADHPA